MIERVRPEDLVGEMEQGESWLADAFGLSLSDVPDVLTFYHHHQAQLASPA